VNIIGLIEQRRIALTPEYEGGWHAEVYEDEETVQYSGYGVSICEAITDALSPKDGTQ
jgi:hypothetical protein